MRLRSVPNPDFDIEFTPEMIEAGIKKLLTHDIEYDDEETVVRSIFTDMYRVYMAAR